MIRPTPHENVYDETGMKAFENFAFTNNICIREIITEKQIGYCQAWEITAITTDDEVIKVLQSYYTLVAVYYKGKVEVFKKYSPTTSHQISRWKRSLS